MKAAVLTTIGTPLEVKEVPEPTLVAGGVILKPICALVSSACKVCFAGKAHNVPPVPFIPGTGGISIIEDIHESVYGLKKGQMVFCNPTLTSHFNDPQVPPDGLLIGWFPVAPNSEQITQVWKNGCFAEKQLFPAENVYPIPDDLAKKVEPRDLLQIGNLCIAYGALLNGKVRAGQIVMVTGASGRLGSNTVMLALALGCATVYVVGRNAGVLGQLQQVDATRVVPVVLPEESQQAQADHLLKDVGRTVDVVIDFLGYVKDATLTCGAAKCLRKGGTLVVAGGVTAPLSLDYSWLLVNSITIVGSFMYPKTAPNEVMRLLATGLVKINALGTASEFSLDNVNDAVEKAASIQSPFDYCYLSINPNPLKQ